MRNVALPLVFAALLACGTPEEGPTAEEADQVQRGGSATTGLGQVSGLADSLFDFDPTLDAAKTAAENATAIQQHIQTGLGTCGTVTLASTTVTVVFAAAGCALPNGTTVKGTVEAGVAKVGSTTTVSLTLTGIDIDGQGYDGTASFATTNATSFTVAVQLTTPKGTQSADVTVAGAANAFTVDGTSSTTQSGKTTSVTYTAVKWTKGACYPEAGSMAVARTLLPSVTVTFDAQTPTTGKVTVKQGRRSFPMQLPAYGSCGASADGG